jgi:hypothetical protein
MDSPGSESRLSDSEAVSFAADNGGGWEANILEERLSMTSACVMPEDL